MNENMMLGEVRHVCRTCVRCKWDTTQDVNPCDYARMLFDLPDTKFDDNNRELANRNGEVIFKTEDNGMGYWITKCPFHKAARKRYKPTRAERKAAMKLEAGEYPMSYKRVVQILMNEYECASRDGCDRACCAQCDLVMNRIDVLTALSLAIHAIQPDILNEFEGEDDD